ncbi:MAG: FecR domain-containing protein [Nitrosomonadales bacterium]|nr:FecR domain-containing protein [Nitrosomonadales bacterium]
MKNIRLSIISATLLVVASSAVQAEAVGRVLIAVGDTTALRNGVVVKLARGAEVQSGDTLRVGEASNMQVRFTDEGITALRSNSSLRIDDYGFENKPGADKSFFSLLKGGMRAITGLIGRDSRNNYAVKALTATIGIRGTNFLLAQCDNDCFNRDGSKAENGLFGGVTDGRIAVTNQAGEKEFGMNEFFHVTSVNALPTPLLAPPSFLRDQLEGQAKSKGGKPPAGTVAAGEGGVTAAAPAPTDTTQPALQIAQYIPAQQNVVQTNLGLTAGQTFAYVSTGVDAVAGIGVGTVPGGSPGVSYPYSGSGGWLDQGVITSVDPALLQQQLVNAINNNNMGIGLAGIAYVMNTGAAATESAFRSNALGPYGVNNVNVYDPSGVLIGTTSFNWFKTASVDTGANALAGNLSWGRYTETVTGSATTYGVTSSLGFTEYRHWANGDPANFAALPTSGTYSYAWVGGTRPTDQNGAVGTMTSGGTVGVQFMGASGANVTLTGVAAGIGATWTMPSGTSYNLSFSNQPVTITQTTYSYANPAWQDSGTSTSISPIVVSTCSTGGCLTCTGTACGGATYTAMVSPMLFGANTPAPPGLAAGIATWPNTPQGVGEHTASVQVYKR